MIKLINLTENTIVIHRRDKTFLEIPVSAQKVPLSNPLTKEFYIVERSVFDAMDNPRAGSFMAAVDPIYDDNGELVGYLRLELLSKETNG